MRLTDIMSNAGLSRFAEIAMVIFMIAFVAIVIRTWAPSRRAEQERARHLPFDDDARDATHAGDRT